MEQHVGRGRTLLGAVLLGLWMLALIGPPLALARWREGRLAELTAPGVKAEWDAFRADMRRQSNRSGPVQRKVPKSPEPPELVWLRDFFPLAVVAWLMLAGVLGGFLVFVAFGATRAGPRLLAEDEPAGGRHDEKQDQRDAEHADKGKHGQTPGIAPGNITDRA